MAKRILGASQGLVTCCALLATFGMATLLVKAPHTSLAYIAMTTPFLFLFVIWKSHHDMAATIDAAKIGEMKTGRGLSSSSLNDRASILAIFGLLGIGIALATGFQLGHMSVR
jgi:hypothetical protein